MVRSVLIGLLLVGVLAVAVASGVLRTGPGSGVTADNLPLAGAIWFGESFDPQTFAISAKETTVRAADTFAFVAHLRRSTKGDEMSMRLSWNGSVVSSVGLQWQGEGDTWGGTAGPLVEPGLWKLDLIDVGGNVLATGSILAR